VEPGHFDVTFEVFAARMNMATDVFESGYRSGEIPLPELDTYFVHDRAMREAGHDTSYRLEGCGPDLVTADLNALLYEIEADCGETAAAERRRELVDRYLWNPDRGMYFDYDWANDRQTDFVSATTFYPLWAGLASQEQAELLVRNALPLLEAPGGIVGS